MKYKVRVHFDHTYDVEANNDEEARKMAYNLQDEDGMQYDVEEVMEGPSYGEEFPNRRQSMYERNRAAVYATGNKWAIENWKATH